MANFKKSQAFILLLFFICPLLKVSGQINQTVYPGDSDNAATTKFVQILASGGTIQLTEKSGGGFWDIKLTSDNCEAKANVVILGQNGTDASNPRGAFEDPSLLKSIIKFSGTRMIVGNRCNKLTIKNIQWLHKGFDVQEFWQPEVDIENVIFDIGSLVSTSSKWGDRVIISSEDGLKGSIKHVSFLGWGARAISFNRTLKLGTYPVKTAPKVVIDFCKFIPHDNYLGLTETRALSFDAGNDEYAFVWNYSNSEVKNSNFINSGIALSKCSHLNILGNIFDFNQEGEVIHLEEFTNNVLINGNTLNLSGTHLYDFVSMGNLQSCNDITITNNTVEQTTQLNGFAWGANLTNIIFSGNEIKNPKSGKFYINFWGCDNKNIQIAAGQPGFETIYQKISIGKCTPVLASEKYFIRRAGTNEYLAHDLDGVVKLITSANVPDDLKFVWEFTHIKSTGYCNIRNYQTEKYLEVIKGPMNAEQEKATYTYTLYTYSNSPIIANAGGLYSETDRKPVFDIDKDNATGKYSLLPGSNERRSELMADGNTLKVYIVKKGAAFKHDWEISTFGKTIHPKNPASINDKNMTNQNEFKVYSNPTNEYLTVEFNETGNSKDLSMFDIHGRLVFSKKGFTESRLNITSSKFPHGMYMVKIISGINVYAKKIAIE